MNVYKDKCLGKKATISAIFSKYYFCRQEMDDNNTVGDAGGHNTLPHHIQSFLLPLFYYNETEYEIERQNQQNHYKVHTPVLTVNHGI